MAGRRKMAAWRSAALCLVLLLLWILRPIGTTPPGSIDTAFDSDRALGRLTDILGDQRPHPTDSAANDAVQARLLAQIRALGFAPALRTRFACNTARAGMARCARPQSIAFWVTPPGDDALLLSAHYDSVPAGPGAADDGMGVAIALEVAHLLKGRALARPVLVLITDAEEAGLVGAAAFAQSDPLATRIGAVVNMEARGTSGIANMFQTSTPNGRDVAALQAGGLVQPANALATDIYRVLPNDTDLTLLLPLGVDAANYAVIGGGRRYHTPRDDLAHLDRASFREMGASVLAAAEGFVRTPKTGAEGTRIFASIGRLALLVLSSGVAALCLGLGLVASLVLVWRGEGAPVRTAVAVPLAMIGGTALAILVAFALQSLRAEAAYGAAWPMAARLAFAAAGLFGAALVLRLIGAQGGQRLAGWAWLWLTALVAAGFTAMPGLSVMVVWPLMAVILAAVAALVPRVRAAVPWLLAVAALLFLLIVLPIAAGIEDALFVEQSAPMALLLIVALLVASPLAGRFGRAALVVTGGALLLGIGAALLVPAFSPAQPQHVTVAHEDVNGKGALVVSASGPLPAAMRGVARFADAPDHKGDWRAPAPELADDGALAVGWVDARRRVLELHARAGDADRQEFLVEKGEGVSVLAVNGVRAATRGPLSYAGCTGRSCRDLTVTLSLDAKAKPDIIWRRVSYGAGAHGAALVAARPATAVPVQSGDRRQIERMVRLPAR